MTNLALAFDLPGGPDAAFAALADPLALRCWYGPPPGHHRVGAGGDVAAGAAVTMDLRDARGEAVAHVVAFEALGPGPRAVLAPAFDRGPLAGPAVPASIAFEATPDGTRAAVAQGPFEDPARAEAFAAFWAACFGRLARLLAGASVAPYEELALEAQAFHDPVGVAAWGVLAGLREAGAPPAAIAAVEATLYAHLPALAPEAGALIGSVMRARSAVLDGWRAEATP